eukprot:1140259-Pelagomonas_calceolata.AAC.1
MRNVSRFRLRAHGLKVDSSKRLGGSNVCDKCESAEVQDENHALFYCFEPLHAFTQLPNTDFIAFPASFHIKTDPE